MEKEKKERVEEDYQFKLSINRKDKINLICLRFFKSRYGLKNNIDEATEQCMDIIYSHIIYQEKMLNTEKDYDTSVIFSVYEKGELITEIEQFLPKNRNYTKINIKEVIREITNNLRANHEKKQ